MTAEYGPGGYEPVGGIAPDSYTGGSTAGFDFGGVVGDLTGIAQVGAGIYGDIVSAKTAADMKQTGDGSAPVSQLPILTASGTPQVGSVGGFDLGSLSTIAIVFGGFFLLSRLMD